MIKSKTIIIVPHGGTENRLISNCIRKMGTFSNQENRMMVKKIHIPGLHEESIGFQVNNFENQFLKAVENFDILENINEPTIEKFLEENEIIWLFIMDVGEKNQNEEKEKKMILSNALEQAKFCSETIIKNSDSINFEKRFLIWNKKSIEKALMWKEKLSNGEKLSKSDLYNEFNILVKKSKNIEELLSLFQTEKNMSNMIDGLEWIFNTCFK